MDDEDFLAAVEADNSGTPVEEPIAEPETPAEPEAAPQEPEQPAPAEPAIEPAPEPVAAPAPTPELPHVPITVMLDEREKRQAAERELQALRQQQAQTAQPAEIPDPEFDPVGYAQYQDARLQNILLDQTLNTSERFARKEHGAETVEAAKAWVLGRFAADPLYRQQVLSDPDPYEKAVTDYKRDQLFAKVTDPSDFDAFLAWKAAQGEINQQPAAAAASPNPAPAIPPPSLASAPSAGSVLVEPEQSDDEIFAETFVHKG